MLNLEDLDKLSEENEELQKSWNNLKIQLDKEEKELQDLKENVMLNAKDIKNNYTKLMSQFMLLLQEKDRRIQYLTDILESDIRPPKKTKKQSHQSNKRVVESKPDNGNEDMEFEVQKDKSKESEEFYDLLNDDSEDVIEKLPVRDVKSDKPINFEPVRKLDEINNEKDFEIEDKNNEDVECTPVVKYSTQDLIDAL